LSFTVTIPYKESFCAQRYLFGSNIFSSILSESIDCFTILSTILSTISYVSIKAYTLQKDGLSTSSRMLCIKNCSDGVIKILIASVKDSKAVDSDALQISKLVDITRFILKSRLGNIGGKYTYPCFFFYFSDGSVKNILSLHE